MPGFTGISHLSLSVSDAAASARWYTEVLGFTEYVSVEGDTFIRRVCRHESGLVLGLQQHHGNDSTAFDPVRTGMDHLSFAVSDRTALEAWAARLAAQDVRHTPIADLAEGSVLSFRDPDGIQLEFFCHPTDTRQTQGG